MLCGLRGAVEPCRYLQLQGWCVQGENTAMAAKMLQLMLVLSTIAVTSIMAQRNIGLSGPEFRELQLGQNPELLQFAAMTGETVLVIIDSAEVLAVVQENVNLNMNCLPWLQRFPGAQLRWLFQAYDPGFMSKLISCHSYSKLVIMY